MKQTKRIWLVVGTTATAALLLAGCSTFDEGPRHRATSLYDYLYSGQKEHVDTPAVPVLSLPLRVGVAFVPSNNGSGRNNYMPYGDDIAFSESKKMELMKAVSGQFKQYPFVKSIDLIPSTYLSPQGGFANLDQLRTMYDVDVMVLLSYDQAQFTDDNFLSFTYLTIVGVYVVPGEKNETRTMLDAAVYDIASRQLLFRAPGVGDVKHLATPINLNADLREDSSVGFQMAATNLVDNLQIQLADFKERVTNAPADYKIQYKPGYTGSGAFGGLEAAMVSGLGACFIWTRRNRKS